jgi:mono/diheme cytochrome c family protein
VTQRWRVSTLAAAVSLFAAAAAAQTFESGKQIYEAGCVSCHGRDGKGQSRTLSGFEPPGSFPDFSDCRTSTPESDVQWRAVITRGGRARAFSTIMPAFGDLLTPRQIDRVIDYVRGLCREPAWPRGNLNLPRAMVTEKAFPENETVVAATFNAQGSARTSTTTTYERRIGSKGMVEAAVPYEFTHDAGRWHQAFGDLALGYKQTLFHSLASGSIVSLGGEVTAPTGSLDLGTGGETTVFETFLAYGQLFPEDAFLQVQTGVELPVQRGQASRAAYFRAAIGKTFAAGGGLGRRWSPMIEGIADRDLVAGSPTNFDVIPQLQMPLSKRQHLLGSVGYRMPVNNTAGRPRQIMFYVLWDWMDGGLFEGW